MDVSPSYGHICILWRYISYPSSCASVSSELVIHNCVLQLGSVDLCSTWDPAVSTLGPQSKPGQLTVLVENTEESTSQKQPLAHKRKAKFDKYLIFFSPWGGNFSESSSRSPQRGLGPRGPCGHVFVSVPSQSFLVLLFPSVTLIPAPWDSLLDILFKSLPQKSTLGNYNLK